MKRFQWHLSSFPINGISFQMGSFFFSAKNYFLTKQKKFSVYFERINLKKTNFRFFAWVKISSFLTLSLSLSLSHSLFLCLSLISPSFSYSFSIPLIQRHSHSRCNQYFFGSQQEKEAKKPLKAAASVQMRKTFRSPFYFDAQSLQGWLHDCSLKNNRSLRQPTWKVALICVIKYDLWSPFYIVSLKLGDEAICNFQVRDIKMASFCKIILLFKADIGPMTSWPRGTLQATTPPPTTARIRQMLPYQNRANFSQHLLNIFLLLG